MSAAQSERTRLARRLFAPLGPTYDRTACVLSYGQDPRWRRFLVSRVPAAPRDHLLDVATGTASVAIALARRYGCRVVGVDQSPEMLVEGRRRVAAAGLGHRVELEPARAEELPFADASFDGLTFTYLLRYVDDPAATLAELARVLKPGAPAAMLEFAVPEHPLTRRLWNVHVDAVLPLAGRAISPGWASVGDFLGPSIRAFSERWPLEELLELWRHAGFRGLRARRLSLGGGLVVWGVRGL